MERCTGATELENGVNDLKLIGDTNRLVIAADCGMYNTCDNYALCFLYWNIWSLHLGSVQIWEVADDRSGFKCLASACEHDDYVAALSINADISKVASASQDQR